MSIGMLLISVELLIMLFISALRAGSITPVRALSDSPSGESLGAAALRIAGGIFTKIAGHRFRPDEDRLQD
jgi:K(+)-stimulated pyrophosphate-energized sodium pump